MAKIMKLHDSTRSFFRALHVLVNSLFSFILFCPVSAVLTMLSPFANLIMITVTFTSLATFAGSCIYMRFFFKAG